MKTPRTPQDNNDEIARANIQKRSDNLYSNQELPSPASISEVEAMKARISELEARLAMQELTGFEPQASPIEKAEKTSSEHTSTHQPSPKPEQEKAGFLRNLLRAPTFGDLAKDRIASLQHKILLGLIFTSLFATIALLITWNATTSPTGLIILLLALGLFLTAFIWQRQGRLQLVSWMLVGIIYLVTILSVLTSSFSFTTVLQMGLVVILAGLLLRPVQVVAITILIIITTVVGPSFDANTPMDPITILFTSIILALIGALLTIASSTLEQSLAEVDKNTKALVNTNKELQNLSSNLEQRVTDRTHDLELASEVGRAITEKAGNLTEMLTEAAETIRSRFNLYYTQVYLVDPSGRNLVLRAGTGDAGFQLLQRGHRLAISSASLNGRAALDRHAVIMGDTQQSSNFRHNPLLPLTRSELAIPLIANNKVVGVLDMQNEKPETFSATNLSAFQVLAGQLAIAIQNAALFKGAEESRLVVEEQAARLTSSGWQQFMNAVDRNENIGYVFSQDVILPWVEAESPVFENTLTVPIEITGATVGEVQLADGTNRKWTTAETEIVQAAVSRVGQHIENLRLFAQSEKYRSEAEQVSRRLTSAGWNEYLETRKELADGYSYNLDKVQPLNGNGHNESVPALSYPLMVRDEPIGLLLVDSKGSSESHTSEVAAAVVEQLSNHIENLRLLEETQQRSLDLEESQTFLDSVVENLPTMLFVKDAEDLRFVRWNKAAEELSGFKLTAMAGKNDYDFFPKEEADFFTSNDRQVLVSGQIVDIPEEPLETAHQGTRYLHTRKVPIYSADGKAKYLLGISEDITEIKHNQEILTQRANQLETVATLSSTASTVLDPDKLLQAVVDLTKERFNMYHTHIYLANDAWNTLLLGAGAGEVGRKMVAEEHAISMDAEKSLVARAHRERQSIIANDIRSQPDFLPNPLLPETRAEMAVPMIVGDVVLGVFDIQSDRADSFTKVDADIYTTLASQVAVALQNARLYVEQAATVTQLRELDRLKSSFLANMSHELRTPLNSILGFTDVMLEGLDGQLTDYMDNDLRLIQKNGQHLLHLINDVLDMAKIESGTMNLNPEKFKIHEVLDAATSITSTLASAKNLSLFIQEDSDQEVEIFADNTRLCQVMINLVNNAIKFTENGNITLKATSLDGSRILIAIKDTGIGIPTDQLESVFKEFSQVDNSTTRKAGGTGLGLPISRRLVEMHGGRLWAESTGISGAGATFFVELPVEARITDIIEKQEK